MQCTVNDAQRQTGRPEWPADRSQTPAQAHPQPQHSTAPRRRPPCALATSHPIPSSAHPYRTRAKLVGRPVQWQTKELGAGTNPPLAPSQRESERALSPLTMHPMDRQRRHTPQPSHHSLAARCHSRLHSSHCATANLHSLWLWLLLSRRASPAKSPWRRRSSRLHSPSASRQHGQCAR